MNNDRELLEQAAKAAGAEWQKGTYENGWWLNDGWWNPLTDDGDALRLAVKLFLSITPTFDVNDKEIIEVLYLDEKDLIRAVEEPRSDDPYAATRRAIVRAAAEIGKGMK